MIAVGGVVRPFAAQEGRADRVAGFGERQLAGGQVRRAVGDRSLQPVRLDEAPIGVGGRGEARRHAHALAAEVRTISPSEAFLPPTRATSPRPISSNQSVSGDWIAIVLAPLLTSCTFRQMPALVSLTSIKAVGTDIARQTWRGSRCTPPVPIEAAEAVVNSYEGGSASITGQIMDEMSEQIAGQLTRDWVTAQLIRNVRMAMGDLPVKQSRIQTKREKDGQVTYQVATIETYVRDAAPWCRA